MTTDIVTAAGEEFFTKIIDGTITSNPTYTVGLYLDATDGITDADYDPSTAITTEPTNTAYAQETDTMSAAATTGDVWGIENDTAPRKIRVPGPLILRGSTRNHEGHSA